MNVPLLVAFFKAVEVAIAAKAELGEPIDTLPELGYPPFVFPPITPPKPIEPLAIPVSQTEEE